MKGAILAIIGIGWLAGQAKGCMARVGLRLYTVARLQEVHERNKVKEQVWVKRGAEKNRTTGKKAEIDPLGPSIYKEERILRIREGENLQKLVQLQARLHSALRTPALGRYGVSAGEDYLNTLGQFGTGQEVVVYQKSLHWTDTLLSLSADVDCV